MRKVYLEGVLVMFGLRMEPRCCLAIRGVAGNRCSTTGLFKQYLIEAADSLTYEIVWR